MSARTGRSRTSGASSVGRSVPPTPTPAPASRSSISSLSTAASASATNNRLPLPNYQPPIHPLTPAARIQLELLLQSYPAKDLNKHLQDACAAMNERVGDINDSRFEVDVKAKKRRKKREKDGKPPDEEYEAQVNGYGQKVDSLTTRLEASLRRAIDGEQGVENLKKALKETHKDSSVAAGSQQQRQTQQQTQATTQATTPGSFPADDAIGNERSEPALPPPPTLTPTFTESHQAHMDSYASLPPSARYAKHNAYIGFKNTIHDSYHAEDGKAVPHPSTWFDANGDTPLPGVTSTANQDEDDDDMFVASARISTKCPITLMEFDEPVTSRLCQHSYERVAFEQLWNGRPLTRDEGPRRIPLVGMQCPVPGCAHRLENADVNTDPVVVRRIKRLQNVSKARADRTTRGGSESGGEERPASAGTGGRSQTRNQVIESGSEDDEDDSADDVDAVTQERPMERTKTPAIKSEKRRRTASRRTADDIEEMDEDD